MSMLNNIGGYWAYIQGIRGLIFGGGAYIRGVYIWNEVSVIFRESEVYGIYS
jgi:hypothetical protein